MLSNLICPSVFIVKCTVYCLLLYWPKTYRHDPKISAVPSLMCPHVSTDLRLISPQQNSHKLATPRIRD